ncbi:MAG: hypothetical protein KH897_09110 [Bacteroides sp.]|nr:hypothetical protein [Bacteroides sp.]
MKMDNKEKIKEFTEYEKARIEFLKGKAEFLQGCGGCLAIPIILVILFCILILISMILAPFID